jgi:MSHA biogenesis protein MshQ
MTTGVSSVLATPALYYAAPRCGYNNQVVVAYRSGAGYAALNTTTAATAANFSVSGRTITSAVFNTASNSTILTLNSAMANVNRYTVNVANVRDVNGVSIPASSDYFYYSTTENGIVGEYFAGNKTFSGTADVQTDANVEASFSGGLFCLIFPFWCGTDMSVRWKGFLRPTQTGNYQFETVSNDGSRLWVNDMSTMIINTWADSSSTVTRTSGNVPLVSGAYYPIRQDFYFDREGFIFYDSGSLVLRWDPPTTAKVTIPNSGFSTCVPITAVSLSQFSVSVPATASACGSAAVTIRAIDSNGNTMTGFTGTVSLSTSAGHGDWSVSSGNGTVSNGTANDGVATYTFVSADNGQVTLALTNRHADVTRVTVNAASEGVSANSSNITFLSNSIGINDESVLPGGMPANWDVVAGRNHSLTVEYAVLDPSSNKCQTANFNGTVNLKFWRQNQTGHPATAAAPNISSGGSSVSLPATEGTAATLALPISSGKGTFSLITTDVGYFNLHVKDDSSGFVRDASGNPSTLTGIHTRGSPITVRPFGIRVNPVGNSWHSEFQLSGISAAAAEGAVYRKAGLPFSMQVTGVRYDVADDVNFDGVPDGFGDADPGTWADLSNNGVTASFGQEGEVLTVNHQLIAPSAGNAGTLSGTLGAFSGGMASGNFSFSEVGIIEIGVQSDASYLSSGKQVLGKSGYVGRFTPDHFTVTGNSPALTHGWLDSDANGTNDWTCSFTYWGQAFGLSDEPELTLTAYNSAGVVTQNYRDAFNKYTGTVGAIVDNGLPVGSTSVLAVPAGLSSSVSNGATAGTILHRITGYATTPYGFSYSKPAVPGANEVPLALDLSLRFPDAGPASVLADSDGVCNGASTCSAFTFDFNAGASNTTTLYFGRLTIDNNFGPEINELLLPYRAEVWQAVGSNQTFITHGEDGDACSGTGGLAVTLDDYLGNLSPGETAAILEPLNDGLGLLRLSAPGAGNDGGVTLTLDSPAFLQFDFAGTGTPQNPSATATFGVYAGKRPQLFFQREAYR